MKVLPLWISQCVFNVSSFIHNAYNISVSNSFSALATIPWDDPVFLNDIASPWWRHQMLTFSALLAICAGNSPVPGEFPVQRPVTRSFYVFSDLRLNKRLSKQSLGWWFDTPPHPLWRHCNAMFIKVYSVFRGPWCTNRRSTHQVIIMTSWYIYMCCISLV